MSLSIKSHFQNTGIILSGRFMAWQGFIQVLQAERLGRKLARGRARDDLRDVLLGFAGLSLCAALVVLGCVCGY